MGQTGEIIDSIDYINVTGNYDDWGKAGDGGNRSARYNIAIGYLPKEAGSTETIPAVFFNRGYYAKTTNCCLHVEKWKAAAGVELCGPDR